METFNN